MAILDDISATTLTAEENAWRSKYLFVTAIELGRYDELEQRLGEQIPLSVADLRVFGRARRSPGVGAIASAVLPGLGQLMSGNPVGAYSALVLNGALIGGTVWAASREQWASAVMVGLVGVTFYSGNVYGGADSAIQFNRRRRDDELEQLSELGLRDEPPPVVLAL
jgi:hypothetical protein